MTGTIFPLWLYHVLDWPMNTGANGGYNFWSGIGSGSPILLALAVWWRHHSCHVRWCPLLHWKATAAGDLVCRLHHPDRPKTHAQILEDHAHANA